MNIQKYINKETILYTIFGVLTTVVDFAAVALLHYVFSINEIVANTIAWCLAVATAYITNKLYVFESKSFSFSVIKKEIPSFILARIFSLLITNVFLAFASIINLNVLLAKAIISVFVIISNYIFSKLFIFKKKEETAMKPIENVQEKNFKMPPSFGPYFFAFIIPVIILIVIFISREVHPFGDSIYLRSDAYHQYAPYYKELYRKLTEGGSLFYSWNIGMGVNFTALYAYYLASPINLLLGVFAINGDILLTMDVLIIIKTGLAGFTFAYYLMKHFGKTSYCASAVAVFYALSSYMAAFSWNIMWIDCIVMLPIIALGIENLVKKKKWLLYTLSLGFAIFSNYYIAIMLCIFSVIYFAITLLAYNKLSVYTACIRILHFIKGSLLAGGLGAVMFLPALYALSYTVSSQSEFPAEWKNYFSILDMLSRSLMSVEVSILNANEPNIYCTVAVFIMIPLYCICSKVNYKEKVGKVAFLALMLLSFNLNIPDFIWHGFHFPNSLPCRESFIYIFLILTMSYEAAVHIKSFTRKEIYSCFFGAVGLFILIEQLYVNDTEYPFEIVYTSLFFLVLYLIIINLYRNPKVYKSFTVYLLIVACISEAAISSNHEASYKTTGYSSYLEDNAAITSLLDSVKSDDFYRVEKERRNTKNDAAWNDYHGVSIFSSTANGNFTTLLGRFGLEQSTNAYSYYGSTPLTSAMLSVKYLITNNEHNSPYMKELVEQKGNRYLYELDYSLPLGYMIPKNALKGFDLNGNDPFLIQNNFVKVTTGYENMFTRISAIANGKTSTIDTTADCDLYIYVTNYVDNISYTAVNHTSGFSLTGSASGLNHRQIVHIGEVPAGTTVTVTCNDENISSLQLYAYAFDKEIFDNAFYSLNDEGLNIKSYDDTHISGTITANEAGTMLTSIIYDRGWNVYVDGKEVEISSFNDGLLMFDVPQGTHEIQLKYTPDGFVIGLTLSIVSAIVIVAIYAAETILKKKKKKEKAQ